jgi:hypothetical protein
VRDDGNLQSKPLQITHSRFPPSLLENRGKSVIHRKLSFDESFLSSLVSGLSLLNCMHKVQFVRAKIAQLQGKKRQPIIVVHLFLPFSLPPRKSSWEMVGRGCPNEVLLVRVMLKEVPLSDALLHLLPQMTTPDQPDIITAL